MCYTGFVTNSMPTVMLRKGRERPIRNRHPWVFSGAVQRVLGEADDGSLVHVTDHAGGYLATGYLNRRSQIVVRLLSWDIDQQIDRAFWRRRLERAILGRARLAADPTTDAYRLVHAEADGLPGLIVDRYGKWLVMQCLTLGMARRQAEILRCLTEILDPVGIYARDDAGVRRKEGLPRETGPLWGQEPPERVRIVEHGHPFWVDLKQGQKTGFYLDQRDNRRMAAFHSVGADVLNAFSYTGGFGVYTGRAGARSVVNVDSSADALSMAQENAALNGCGAQEMVLGDVFQVLRAYREQGRAFDMVILDPPKFATSQRQVRDAARGYKDANLMALHLLRPGGMLVTFSCSGRVSVDLFQKIVFGASVDARRNVQIVGRLSQGLDHPVLLTFPESAYLKGLLCRVW